jgi:hypothetical protein
MFILMALIFGASMASDTVLKVWDAFLQVFFADFVGLMLVAAVTGPGAVVAARMAGRASDLMIAFEDEESAVLEGGWLPALRRVAWGAIGWCILMHRGCGCGVAGGAIPSDPCLQEDMSEEGLTGAPLARGRVVAMASQTILCRERLMEGGLDGGLRQRVSRAGLQANFRHGMAGDATLRDSTTKGRVASGAMTRERGMTWQQRTGTDHPARVQETQCHQPREAAGCGHPDPRELHRHPP